MVNKSKKNIFGSASLGEIVVGTILLGTVSFGLGLASSAIIGERSYIPKNIMGMASDQTPQREYGTGCKITVIGDFNNDGTIEYREIPCTSNPFDYINPHLEHHRNPTQPFNFPKYHEHTIPRHPEGEINYNVKDLRRV